MPQTSDSFRHPGLWRVLAAIFYDSWLIGALILLGATGDTFIRHLLMNYGSEMGYTSLQLYCLLAPLGFFAGFWTHGGQTLGMRAWRIRVVTPQGEPVTAYQATIRYFAAMLSWLTFGLGYLWIMFDPAQRSWHDRLSGTCLVLVIKPSAKT
ncbi:MAG: RDD family protein [Pseudomonadota bacterium]